MVPGICVSLCSDLNHTEKHCRPMCKNDSSVNGIIGRASNAGNLFIHFRSARLFTKTKPALRWPGCGNALRSLTVEIKGLKVDLQSECPRTDNRLKHKNRSGR